MGFPFTGGLAFPRVVCGPTKFVLERIGVDVVLMVCAFVDMSDVFRKCYVVFGFCTSKR